MDDLVGPGGWGMDVQLLNIYLGKDCLRVSVYLRG